MKKNIKASTKILILCLIIVGVVSCENKSDCCVVVDRNVSIHYQTQSGDNLINSTEEYNESNFRIYYKNGEEYEYINRGNLSHPKMYKVDEGEDGKLIMTIFPSNYYEGKLSTTLIKLIENVVDTLVCEFSLGENREVCTNAWLNGIEMDNRFIEVKK